MPAQEDGTPALDKSLLETTGRNSSMTSISESPRCMQPFTGHMGEGALSMGAWPLALLPLELGI